MNQPLAKTIWDIRKSFELSSAQTLLLIKFIDLAENGILKEAPTLTDLAKETNFTERTTQSSLKLLMEKSLLLKIADSSPKNHSPNIYQVNIQILQDYAREGVR